MLTDVARHNAIAQYIETMVSKAGLPFVSSFLKSGSFVVVAAEQELPWKLRKQQSGQVRSVYDPTEHTTWFVAGNIPLPEVYGNMLREIGIHFGLSPMLGVRKTKEVIADARHLAIIGNPAVLKAWRKVVSGEKSINSANDDAILEAIGYLVEDPQNHDMGIARKIFSSVKIFLFKKNFPVGRLSTQDMAVLASSAAREAVRVRRRLSRKKNEAEQISAFDDRRRDSIRRKAIEDMTPEEMRRELLVDSLTGLGNRRALEEKDRVYREHGIQKIKVFIDVDSLKFVNDHLGGHDAGDKLLVVIGRALGQATKNSFRLSGDEFCFLAESEEEGEKIANKTLDALRHVVIKYEVNGRVFEYKNPGFSYGIGEDLETADKNMLKHKEKRSREGLRADRAHPPPGLAEVTPPGRNDNDHFQQHGQPSRQASVKEYLETFSVAPMQEEDSVSKKVQKERSGSSCFTP